MTIDEASRKFSIPIEILSKYKNGNRCGAAIEGACQYDDGDLERLSMIMTLYDIGFSAEETNAYLHLLSQGDAALNKRLEMLEQRRSRTLDEIHFREKQMDCLDYLRHQIQKDQKELRKNEGNEQK